MTLKFSFFLAVSSLLASLASADTTDYCGKHNKAISKACTQACEVANGIRQSQGLPLMEADPAICRAAKVQAQYLFKKFGSCSNRKGKEEKKKCMSHSGQGVADGGAALSKRLQDAGAGFHLAGENINIGYADIDGAFHRGWMKSKVHRQHLVDRRFRRQGYAEAGPYRVHVLTD